MKPQNLLYPFKSGVYHPTVSQGVLFIPKRIPDHFLHDFRSLFPTYQPVHVEFCSGNGEWVVAKALEHPEIFWIAIEMKFDRVQKIWSKAQNQGVKNLLIIHGEASLAVRYYMPESLADHFFVNFPDPWPKFCHAKYRLINQEFLRLLSRLGKKNAFLTFVSDDEEYIQRASDEVSKSPFWGGVSVDPFDEVYGKSYFYRLWKSQDKRIQKLQARNSQKNMVYPLRLNLSLQSDLKWEQERRKALELIDSGYRLEIHLDLQLELNLSSLSHLGKFNTYLLSVEAFSSSFYPDFKDHIENVVLYKGPLDFISLFFQKPADFVSFISWLEETFDSIDLLNKLMDESFSSFDTISFEDLSKKSLGRQYLRLFAISVFSEYLHRLASKLPEDIMPALLFDTAGVVKEIFYEQLTSQEIFPHFKILGQEASEGIVKAIVIPSVEKMSLSFVKTIEKYIQELSEPLRYIPERYLSESWLGIDQMVVCPSTLSPIGSRQLKGFEVAGGEILNLEERSLAQF